MSSTQASLSSAITCVTWCPNEDSHLYYGSWNKTIGLVDIEKEVESSTFGSPTNSSTVAQNQFSFPVLDVSAKDKSSVFVGTCGNKIYCWNPEKNYKDEVGTHNSGVKCVKWLHTADALLTGSWDQSCKIWDFKQQDTSTNIDVGGKVYSLDSKGDLFVVATSENKIKTFDLRKTDAPMKVEDSPLRMQLRCISIFSDLKGYVVGSIEGRCGIQYFDDTTKNFCFKCHRVNENVYPVNSIDFHPTLNTFVTCGGDFMYANWDKDAKKRLFHQDLGFGYGYTTAKFNENGDKMAIASSYDFSQGYTPQVNRKSTLLTVNVQLKNVTPWKLK
eukprot:gene3317-5757_t